MRVLRVLPLVLVLLAAVPAAQIDPRSALVERAAWTALNAGQAHAAAEGFRDALEADPRNARLHLGAGMAASLERRDADARSEFERALGLDPKLMIARAMLGQIQYRMGDRELAVRTYETLVAMVPDDGDARATLERWRREADLATEALEILDRAYWRISQLLGSYPAAPIDVVLYTKEQFRDITRAPAWAAGAYDGIIRVPMRGALDEPQELDRVLSHEFTHALIRTLAARGVPTWLNEGLATALETGDLGWAEEQTRGRPPVPLNALNSGFSRFTGGQAQLAYATSALAARRLLDEAGG